MSPLPVATLRKLLGDLKAVRAHHAYTRDHIGQPGCEVRKVAAEYTQTLDDVLDAFSACSFPQPRRQDGKEPCGECRLPAGETCDICGASA